MRTIVAYLNRRGVKDAAEWRKKKGLHTMEAVKEWCSLNNIAITYPEDVAKDFFGLYNESHETKAQKDETRALKTADPKPQTPNPVTSESATWHTPAAERPITKSSPRNKPKRNNARKSSRSKKGEK